MITIVFLIAGLFFAGCDGIRLEVRETVERRVIVPSPPVYYYEVPNTTYYEYRSPDRERREHKRWHREHDKWHEQHPRPSRHGYGWDREHEHWHRHNPES